jgi:hypothetical protein
MVLASASIKGLRHRRSSRFAGDRIAAIGGTPATDKTLPIEGHHGHRDSGSLQMLVGSGDYAVISGSGEQRRQVGSGGPPKTMEPVRVIESRQVD